MKNKRSETTSPYVSRGSVIDDLGFLPSEALELKVKAELYRELMQFISEHEFGQAELCAILGIHQPDVSNFLSGRISKFSVGKLIKFAGKLNLGARVTLTRPDASARAMRVKRQKRTTVTA